MSRFPQTTVLFSSFLLTILPPVYQHGHSPHSGVFAFLWYNNNNNSRMCEEGVEKLLLHEDHNSPFSHQRGKCVAKDSLLTFWLPANEQ